jgi:hypothetical protein
MLAAAAGLAFCAGAAAQVFSSRDHESREQVIAVRFRSASAGCASLAADLRAVCAVEADAEERIARSDLEARYRPSAKARHHALVVAADSRHAVARVRCDARTGVARNTCAAEAKAVRAVARDKAGAQLKAAQATARAREQSAEDREEASSDTVAARYAAARQQCDVYVDRLRALCLVQTRDRFIKQP